MVKDFFMFHAVDYNPPATITTNSMARAVTLDSCAEPEIIRKRIIKSKQTKEHQINGSNFARVVAQ